MAGYLCMRYSYAWDVTLSDLTPDDCGVRGSGGTGLEPTYVRIRPADGTTWIAQDAEHPLAEGFLLVHEFARDDAARRPSRKLSPKWNFYVWGPAKASDLAFKGRLNHFGHEDADGYIPIVMTWASRWRPASIAGLVVGAMGVFVLTVALRQWLKERRVFGASGHE